MPNAPRHPDDTRNAGSGDLSQFLVLGVHRSGTSLLAETAIRLGLHGGSPEELDGADQWNANGYWEHRAVRALNEDVLSAAATDWFGGLSFNADQVPSERREEFAARAIAIVASLDAHAPWIVKDPRLCVLMPFWQPFLSKPAFLISLRHPLSVAKSLRERDGFPLPFGIALWETQLLSALASAKGAPRTAFWYEDLVSRPEEQVARLSDWLRAATGGRGGTAIVPPAADARLRHHVIDRDEEGARLPAGALRLLGALRNGDAFDDSFDTAPSEDASALIRFVDDNERTRRYLEHGWRAQQAAHREAVETHERMVKAKDDYISELLRQAGADHES
jgi:hypothetical protein